VTPEEFKEMRQILWQFVPIENYGEALAELEKIARRTVSGQEAQPVCAHCNGTDVELLRLCHNPSCSAYAREESFYKGWEDNAAPIPATDQK
jgi:hypothetical protein